MDSLINDPDVQEIFKRFHERNFEIFIVGGAVRDFLLKETIEDIDFTTNAKPEEIKELFSETIDIGKRFGTIKVKLNNRFFEITTYRSEDQYTDSRHPDKLKFTNNLEQDLSRRDFTINGLCLDENNKIIDKFNGLEDLDNKVIRTIGNPEERFNEDQLRKWRALRFAIEKDFKIENKTLLAISQNPDTSNISIERIREEFNRILLSKNVSRANLLFNQTQLFNQLLKRIGINNKFLLSDNYVNLIFQYLPNLEKDLEIIYSALVDPMSYQEAELFLNKLKLSKQFIKTILNNKLALSFLEEILNKKSTLNKYNLKKLISISGRKKILSLLNLAKVKYQKKNEIFKEKQIENSLTLVKKILDNNEPIFRKDLAINGNDLLESGFKGSQIKIVLNYLMDMVLNYPEFNNKEKLKELIDNVEFNFSFSN